MPSSSSQGWAPLAQLREMLSTRNTPSPPLPLRPLGPDPQGKIAPTISYAPRPVIPPSPTKPSRLSRAQARAARLLGPRRPRLERARLHHRHDHQDLGEALLAADAYLDHETPPPPSVRSLSPWTRHVLAGYLADQERETRDHKWDRLWRIEDLRRLWSIA